MSLWCSSGAGSRGHADAPVAGHTCAPWGALACQATCSPNAFSDALPPAKCSHAPGACHSSNVRTWSRAAPDAPVSCKAVSRCARPQSVSSCVTACECMASCLLSQQLCLPAERAPNVSPAQRAVVHPCVPHSVQCWHAAAPAEQLLPHLHEGGQHRGERGCTRLVVRRYCHPLWTLLSAVKSGMDQLVKRSTERHHARAGMLHVLCSQEHGCTPTGCNAPTGDL